MLRGVVLLGASLAAGCANTAAWTRLDTSMLAVNVACNAVDYAQTEWALDNGFREVNPMLGESPSDGQVLATKVATQALIYRLADQSDNRALTLGLALVPCLAVVGHNYAQGARF